MGVSTDAILVFGFSIGSESEGDEAYERYSEAIDGEDFEDFVIDKSNLDRNDPDYFKKRQQVLDNCPISITVHCSDSEPMVILAIRGTETVAWRGDVQVIDPASLVVPEEKIQAAKEWCEKYDFPWDDPKWLLVSWWG